MQQWTGKALKDIFWKAAFWSNTTAYVVFPNQVQELIVMNFCDGWRSID